MKEKFLHKRDFGTIFLLMIGLFLMLFPNTAKAQSYTDDTRFAVTVKQSGDIVTMEAFFVGPAVIDAANWGFFYDPAMLRLYDTLLTTPLNYYGEASASMDDFDDVLKFQGLFLDEGFTFMGDGFHLPAMDYDDNPIDEKYSGNHFMNVFFVSASPNAAMNVISVAQGEVIPFFTCYFKKISEGSLTSAHFGIGTNVSDWGYAPSFFDYTTSISVGYVDHNTTYDEVNPEVFLYRSPSRVISKSAVTTQNSATLTGTFASWSTPPSETLFDGETEESGTVANYKAGRLRGDTIRSRGFIYTEADADVDFTFSEFSPMATINGITINLRDSIANVSNSFTVGGNVYHVVTANSSNFYADATDYSATVNGLTEDEEYYAWAFGLYTFETSNVFAAVGERLEFTITATRCDLQAGSVYIEAYPSCAAGGGSMLPVQTLSDISTSDDGRGTVHITVTGGSGLYEYTYTKYGEDSVRQYSDLYLVNGAEYYIGGLEVGTYRFYIRDKNNPSCEVVSESVVLGTQAYGATTEFLTEVSDASACGQPNGRITFQMTPFSDDYFDDHAVAFYLNGEKLPETAMVEGTIISGTYTIPNLAPGTYVLLATFTKDDASLCAVSSQEIRVGARNGGLAVAVVATPESACKAADGTLAFAITGGAAPYTYQINGMLVDTTNAATFTVTGLTAGSHVWNIVDATGCRANGRETMDNTANPDFEVQVATTGIACTGGSKGSITLTITGGTAPYFYSCKDTIRHAFNAGNTPTLSNLDKGIYDITVYDAEGCVFAYQNVVIDEEPIVMGVGTIYAQQQPTCSNNDGSIYVEVTGDYNNYAYSLYLNGDDLKFGTLSGGVGTISGLGAGTYYVEISAESPNNCGFVYSEPLVLTNADSDLKLVAFAHDADACGTPTGSISFQTTGGNSSNYTYLINGQPTSAYDGQSTGTILNQSPGSYVISVSDQQCSASSGEIIIGAVNGLAVDLTGMVNATCDSTDGSVQLTVTSGGTAPYAYQIDGKQEQYMLGSTAVVTGLAAGDHVWTVYDATGCQTEGRVTILNKDENGFFVTATSTDMTCAGDSGTITLNITNGNVNGNYSYTYDSHGSSVNFVGNQVTIRNLTVGNYDITIRDEDNDCDFMIQNIIIGTGTNLQVATINAAQQATSCAGDDGQIYIAVTGGSGNYNYSMQIGRA
ncbi:MAG: SprB repeat-containing protein, partial [Bacteroidales bacterium]|nr:SprB repeat-containing protein [Bacteroidales bacterium]